jgi:hypothetical protein
MLLEFGSVEDASRPGRKAQWLSDMARLLTSPAYGQFRAALYWDDQHTGQKISSACDFDYRTSRTALAAWRAVATVPALAARSKCAPGECTRRGRRISRLPLLAGGTPIALVLTGLVAVGIHRHRKTA